MTAEPRPAIEPEAPKRAEPEFTGGPELTILEHLAELRNRVLVSGIALVVGILVCFFFWQDILGLMLEPAQSRLGDDYRLASFSPTDRIVALFKIGLYGGMVVASPVIIYEIMAFVVPGLTPKERRVLFFGMFGAVFFLVSGMAFAYFVILPVSLDFLLGLASDQTENVTGIKQYTDFVVRVVFFVGLSFELPMVIALAARIGLVNARQLIGFWRYAIVLVFVVAAIVTPTPDPLTQTLVAGPLLGLYVVGIVFAWILYKPREGSVVRVS